MNEHIIKIKFSETFNIYRPVSVNFPRLEICESWIPKFALTIFFFVVIDNFASCFWPM